MGSVESSYQDIVQNWEFLENPHNLKRAGDSSIADFIRGQPGNVLPFERYGAGGGGVKSCDAIEEGGFAGPVGADQADDLPFVHSQVHLIVGPQAAEILYKLLHFQ